MPVESSIIATGLQELLSNESDVTALVSTRIYDSLAPQNPTFPFIRFQQQSDSVVNNSSGERIMVTPLWYVFASGKTNKYSSIYPIVNAFDELLHGNRVSVSGGRVMAFTRVSGEIRLAYTRDGADYREIGLGYRVTAQQG